MDKEWLRLPARRRLEPKWPQCGHVDNSQSCAGIRVDGYDRCLAHLQPDQLDQALARLRPGSDVDVRGTVLSGELLSRILSALSKGDASKGGRAEFGRARFDEAQFSRDANFTGVRFDGHASFMGAEFGGRTGFDGVEFNSPAQPAGMKLTPSGDWERAEYSNTEFRFPTQFMGAKFSDKTAFREVKFIGGADFRGAKFGGAVRFDQSTFSGDTYFCRDVSFDEPEFSSGASFIKADFSHRAYFLGARFGRGASFTSAEFHGEADFRDVKFCRADFEDVTFGHKARFEEATFDMTERFGPVTAVELRLARAAFHERVLIEVDATTLDCVETTFAAGVTLRLRHARTNLERAVFAKPSTITAVGRRSTSGPGNTHTALSATPELISVRGSDVSELVLTDLDLSCCRFAGAHHLDNLRLEGTCRFGRSRRLIPLGSSWPTAWQWTGRQVLAEERSWRELPKEHRRIHRQLSQSADPATPSELQQVTPQRIADLYRQLRKALEDSKNEPGAADFYYGEMEMRRHAATTSVPERIILHLYWLASGYGLRALRALTVLATLITLVTIGFQWTGFLHAHPDFGETLIYVAQSTVGLETKLASLPKDLTWQGEVMRLVMRLAGPLLLALALLAVRNRVKR